MDRPFYPGFILKIFPLILSYLPVTLGLMAGTMIAGSCIGFLLARARLRNSPAGTIARVYIMIMRCTPSIVLLFLVYYAVPITVKALTGIDINRMSRAAFVIITLSMLFGANLGELMRAAYLSVDPGQREAALSAGMTQARAFFRIILPQAVTSALPNLCNTITALLKEGALAYTIGMIDMMGQGNLIIARNYGSYGLETWITLAIIYWAITVIIERSFLFLEKRLSRGRRSVA
jgi:L-cystine transport system permease protein